ncbi:hypothetical protein GCM10019016_090210 [Streptomyces prasinosporus]|uniref:30S ribosomal protein S4 n=1 Tax=Streptomyces prasinosporus TaxID=68256 RepID=A0ABP6U5F9_9ACTN
MRPPLTLSAAEHRKGKVSVANQSRPKVKKSRALGIALTPKAVKYFEARPYPPG